MRNWILILVFLPFSLKGQTPDFLRIKADSLYESGEYSICTELYRKADSLYSSSDKKKALHCKCRLADCMTREGDLENSEKVAESALDFCSDELSDEKANVLNTLGVIQLGKGKQDLAEEYFNKSLSQFKKNEKSLGKAQCYTNIGLLNWVQYNQQSAVEHMYQALEMRKELLGESHPMVAAAYNNLGLIYSNEDPQKAIDFYHKALDIYLKVFPLNHPSIAVAFNNIGIIQRKQNDPAASLKTFEKSLQIWTSLYGQDHPKVAFVYTNMGESYLASGQTMTALEYQQKALRIYQKNYGEKHPEIASTYNFIGNIYSDLKNYPEALSSFQSAICANIHDFNDRNIYINPTLGNYYNPDILLVSLLFKARALESLHYTKTLKLKDLTTSFNTLAVCDSLIEKLRQVRTGSKDKIELGKLGSEIYEDAIHTAIDLSQVSLKKKYYLEKAFYYSEKNKGAVLLESIADAQAKSFAGIPDSILEKEKSLKSEISFVEQKIAQGPKADEEKILRNNLFELNRTYEQLILDLEKNFPDYFNLKYNTHMLSIKNIQAVLEGHEAVLSYFLAENKKRIFIFCISHTAFKVYNFPLNEKLNKQLAVLKNSIKLSAGDAYVKSAHELYQTLIPYLPGKIKKLIVIPDGHLGSIPFEALITKVKKNEAFDYSTLSYLIRDYDVVYNYSSGLFYNSRKMEHGQRGDKPHHARPSILLCAPVDFKNQSTLNSLPGSAAEVEEINKFCKEREIESKVLMYDQANEKNIKSQDIKRYDILHFATHGIVNEEKPELSQIFLSVPKDASEDGNLFSGEIYNLNLNAALTVLSACQTGLGKVKKGEGIIGLSRALIYAGSSNVMVSLWTVSDQSTSELMVQYYTLRLPNVAQPLQLSKLQLIKNKQFSAPYFWAPFIYIGN